MQEIFSQGAFSTYRIEDARYSNVITETRSFSAGARRPIKNTVFISHKHDDLEDLKGFIGYLERIFNVECYIDSDDPGMPEKTSGETAERIKRVIRATDRFILLATDNAVASKWCNWELGYGDAQKYRDRIAILPMKNTNRYSYTGNEYMQIYPRIVKIETSDITSNNRLFNPSFPTSSGFYVLSANASGRKTYTPLNTWLH